MGRERLPASAVDDRVASVHEDPWGAALAELAAAWAGGSGLEPSLAAAESAADAFRRLGTAVLEAWARGIAALAASRAALPDAREDAASAESLARATGTPAARQLAHAALAIVEPARGRGPPPARGGDRDRDGDRPARVGRRRGGPGRGRRR